MTTFDADLEALLEEVSSECARKFERKVDVVLDAAGWSVLAGLGLTDIMSRQGGTWFDAVSVLRATARHGVAVPIAEHDLLAGWLREAAGLNVRSEMSTAALLETDGCSVPWLPDAERAVLCLVGPSGDGEIIDIAVSELSFVRGRDVARRAIGTPTLDAESERTPVSRQVIRELRLRGALARAAQISGALRGMVSLAVEHARTRVQFGRPISAFQSVQGLIVEAAAESVLADAAVNTATSRAHEQGLDHPASLIAVATAKAVTSRAASTVARRVHQVHGAMGTTIEHPLQTLSRPVLAWCAEYGHAGNWEQLIGDHVVAETSSSDVSVGPAWSVVVR